MTSRGTGPAPVVAGAPSHPEARDATRLTVALVPLAAVATWMALGPLHEAGVDARDLTYPVRVPDAPRAVELGLATVAVALLVRTAAGLRRRALADRGTVRFVVVVATAVAAGLVLGLGGRMATAGADTSTNIGVALWIGVVGWLVLLVGAPLATALTVVAVVVARWRPAPRRRPRGSELREPSRGRGRRPPGRRTG